MTRIRRLQGRVSESNTGWGLSCDYAFGEPTFWRHIAEQVDHAGSYTRTLSGLGQTRGWHPSPTGIGNRNWSVKYYGRPIDGIVNGIAILSRQRVKWRQSCHQRRRNDQYPHVG